MQAAAAAPAGEASPAVPPGPPSELRFRRTIRPIPVLRELVRARALIRALAERELRARYKQTILGFAWAIVTPVTLMIVFTLFFKRVAQIDTGGAPYPLYVYIGLIPWTFFSSSISSSAQTLINNLSLLNKVYCPREVFPLGSIAVSAIDGLMATSVLGVLFLILPYTLRLERIYVLPLLILVQLAFTIGVALIASIITVYFRDLRQALPILLQLGLFATPVAYGIEAVPKSALPFYSAINPLAPVIDGYRRVLLHGQPPDWGLLGIGATSAFVVLVGGYVLFKRLETAIADVA